MKSARTNMHPHWSCTSLPSKAGQFGPVLARAAALLLGTLLGAIFTVSLTQG
jgi:hypothetical protein